MGNVTRLLFVKTILAPSMYANKRSIETAESLHLHQRNLRLEYSRDEFDALVEDVAAAGKKWLELGRPRADLKTVYLGLTDIDPQARAGHGGRFAVEENTYPTLKEPTIHLHYHDLRIEFTQNEWMEFAKGIAAALEAYGR